MKLNEKMFVLAAVMSLFLAPKIKAQNTMPPSPAPQATASDLEMEKKQLEVERLQLENDKLKLEMEKMKLESSSTPEPARLSGDQGDGASKEKQEDFFLKDASKKAQDLAEKNKDAADLLVLDLVNAEGWYKDVRYNLHDLYSLAEDQKWPLTKKVDGRKPSGVARNLYHIKNFSLLRYEDRDRGILEFDPPQKDGDLKIMTPDGVTFDSSVGDVRNAFQNIYYNYDGQEDRDGLKVIHYAHGRGLSFSDKIEILIDKEGKIKAIRYGVLDEK